MSHLRIEHTTVYSYQRKVAFGQHRLVLRPREGHDVRVESMTLQITPEHRLLWARDVYNNSVATVDFLAEAAQLEICSTVIIQRSHPFPSEAPSTPCRVPMRVEYDALELPLVAAYLTLSYPDDIEAIRSLIQQLPPAGDAESMLMNLCTMISRQIKYQRRTGKGVQTPAETLQLRSGSCRDLATLMMDTARALGMSARFASGYLDCPASEAGRASTHAWTEVYLPILGWRGFDPTLGEPTSLKHIVIGVSQHPRGVMPISGEFRGTSTDFLGMSVNVKVEKITNHPREQELLQHRSGSTVP